MKRVVRAILWIVVAIAVFAVIALTYIKFALPSVKEAADIKVENTPERIARGEYLAKNVLNCIDCHSKRDFSLFAGPTVAGTEGQGGELFDESLGLPGKLYSKNITPHNLSSWSDGEIYRLLTTGVKKDGEPVFPFMPYQSFRQLDGEDLKSVIAYIRTLKPIENAVSESSVNFPVNFIMRTLPKDVEVGKKPSPSNQVEYGKYIVNIAACSECHTKMEKGQPVMEMYLAGGNEFPLTGFGTVRSLNITPDKETGIGNWTQETFINKFKSPEAPHNKGEKIGKGDFQTIMPWTGCCICLPDDGKTSKE
jgi:mono/diheme cytochrome c family protein